MNTDKPIWYVDSSVLLRIIMGQSPAAEAWFNSARKRGDHFVASVLLDLEVNRTENNNAIRTGELANTNLIQEYLADINLVKITPDIIDNAKSLEVILRAADSIHVATAHDIGADIIQLVTHDAQMAAGAIALGLTVIDPVTDDPGRLPVG